MKKPKAIVIEINEVPLKILNHYQKLKPNSAIARLLQESLVLKTEAKDVDESFLYPSQTWGSLNTGTPYAWHKIHWYSDPKPESYPLYWKIVARSGLKVGLVNTLHSSPANSYINSNNYQFVIPDCFAINNLTKPKIYEDFQALNTSATSENGRTATMKFPRQKALATLIKSPALGIKSRTLLDAASLVTKIKTGKVNKERLRNLQFTLLADIFYKQITAKDVDLGIFFTNHVAANMHRYWYGLFPEDYKVKLYDDNWINKFSQEILVSVGLLDNFLGKLIKYARLRNSALILVSSMGQVADNNLKETRMYSYRLENIGAFLHKLCPERQFDYQINAGMVPQYSLSFETVTAAAECFQSIEEAYRYTENIYLRTNLNQNIITITASLTYGKEQFSIAGKSYSDRELGFRRIAIEDHKSGKHSSEGTLIVYNSPNSTSDRDTINYLEYAPAMLKFFGLETPEYAIEPQFKI